MIASVDDRLCEMLEGHAESKAYLQKGPAFTELPSSQDCFPRASRHDRLVAHLCNVGVRAVHSSRARAAAAQERGQRLPAASGNRGAKRKTVVIHASSQNRGEEVKEQKDCEEEKESSSALAAAGYDTIHGVAGHYVQGSKGNAENHAIALVLGRLYMYALVKNIPDDTVAGILTLFHLAGVDIGQKHHHRGAISSFAGIVASMCIEGAAKAFADKPKNLQHPSCWRLIFDGVTLRSGVTVTVVLVCYTSAEGDIEVEYIGCSRCGARSNAADTGQGVLELLNKTLKISDSNALCESRRGLRLSEVANVAASSQDREGRRVQRGVFLTSMPVDRAYSGRTGSGADAWLSEKLGVRGLLGTARRVGMSDLFHCFDGCAQKVWHGGEKQAKKRRDEDEATEESELSEDEDRAPGQGDALALVAWARVCRQLRAILGRGQGNFHLQAAYKRCGIHGRPKITIPGVTRMIVYSSRFLEQSFAHFRARYEALCAYDVVLEALAGDPSNKARAHHRKRREKIVRVGSRLARASNVLPAFLVHLCLSLPGGFIEGALQVQKTAAVFFPLHVCVHRVRLHLYHLGLLPPALARLQAVASAPSQGHEGQVRAVTGVRCPACGLLKRSGAAMMAHIRSEHFFPDGQPRRRHFVERMFQCVDVLRPERYLAPPRPDPSAEADVVEPLTGIAARQLRQRSDGVSSIWEVERLLHMFRTLLDYAAFPAAGASARGHLPQLPDVVRWFFAAMGSRECKPVWRTYQRFISLSCGYIVSGRWQGRSIESFSRVERSVQEAARGRARSLAAVAAGTAAAATRYAREFFRQLSAGYAEEVIRAHGDHIPLRVRDDSAVLFWLPEILPSRQVRRPSEFSPETSRRFWQAKLKRLPHVLAHVANQLSTFEWPSTETVMRQYKDLMHAWSRLSEADDVAKQVFHAPSQGHFDWEIWWKLSHTDSRFLPPGCEAAFALFHFMGMVGVSEARAESIASTLKKYSPPGSSRLSTDRIIEKTIVRNAGVNGLTTDDLFLLRCWVEYFGGMQEDRFSFRFQAAKRQKKKFPLGGGSQTIHRHLKRAQQEGERNKKWKRSIKVLRSLPRIGRAAEGHGVIAGSSKWRKFLCRQG